MSSSPSHPPARIPRHRRGRSVLPVMVSGPHNGHAAVANGAPAYRVAPRLAPVLAAERRDPYDAAPPPGVGASVPAGPGTSTDDAAPFGLPLLAELPAFAHTLSRLVEADAALREVVLGLSDLLATGEVESTTGVDLETWVTIVARQCQLDRRFLLRTARLLPRFPALAAGTRDGRLSWAQLRSLSLALRELPAGYDQEADGLLRRLLDELDPDVDPDVIVRQLRDAIARWRDRDTPDHDAPARNRLVLQPTLDGTGGTGFLELDPVALAIVDDATAPRRDQLDHPGGIAGIRADNLLARLFPTHPAGPDLPGPASASTVAPGPTAPETTPPDGSRASAEPDASAIGAGRAGALPPVQLLVRIDLDTVLDTGRMPVELLTRLLGGKLHVTSSAARRLLDTHGASLRTMLVDDGSVVGVGRATRVPPRFLRDAVLSVHDTCSDVGCDRPARGADLDHAVPWHPIDDRPPGTTDLSNVAPLCDRPNREKEAAGWRATQRVDGRRTWHHPRTGLRMTTVPARWRPPPGADPPASPDPAADGGG